MTTLKCTNCQRDFPFHLVNKMTTNQGDAYVCPLCALDIRNKMHGMPSDTPFMGKAAAALWREADDWVKQQEK